LKAYALNFVAELRTMTGGAPAVFVGSSFGGWFAWTLAAAFHEAGGEVRGVVLTEPYYWGPKVGVGADLALCYARGKARVQSRIARRKRFSRWANLHANLHQRLQRLALRGLHRAPLWNYPPKPANVEWNASHPHHKLISPLLTQQMPVVAPFDVLVFVRLEQRPNFEGFRMLVSSGGRLTFCRMSIVEHHGFIFPEHGAFIAWKMRRTFRLSGGGSPRGF
jgi:pimeloyl-ACP methyl ester carboxylesterase